MRRTHLLAAMMACVLCPAPASAQAFEAGGGVAHSCQGLDGVPCHTVWGRAASLYGGRWVTRSIEIELRGTRLDGPHSRIVAIGERISPTETRFRSYTLRGEERRLVQISLVYHFLEGRSVRPFAGGGWGHLWWKGDATCEPPRIACTQVLPNGTPGPLTDADDVITVTGGVAVQAARGVTVRSGLRSATSIKAMREDLSRQRQHDPPPSPYPLQLPEFFVSVGYRW